MFCYSNNGYSMRSVDNDYIAQQGEILFTDYATIDQLNTAFPLYNSGIPILSTDEKIILIEEKYEQKFDAQLKLIMKTIASNSVNKDEKITIFQNEYNELSNQKDLEIIELLGGI